MQFPSIGFSLFVLFAVTVSVSAKARYADDDGARFISAQHLINKLQGFSSQTTRRPVFTTTLTSTLPTQTTFTPTISTILTSPTSATPPTALPAIPAAGAAAPAATAPTVTAIALPANDEFDDEEDDCFEGLDSFGNECGDMEVFDDDSSNQLRYQAQLVRALRAQNVRQKQMVQMRNRRRRMRQTQKQRRLQKKANNKRRQRQKKLRRVRQKNINNKRIRNLQNRDGDHIIRRVVA